ncbi:MAG: isoleucine--tRNA ligase [Treponema sp.]|nr:isoleucine--tRNA ligase [Treponema sp.]
MYNPVDPKVSFPKLEEEILAFWEEEKIFQQSVSRREGNPDFVFYDGPPFATGLPHFGHFVPSTIKDIIPRYKTMKGFHVERRFGWDCHGLPVETLIEKELGLDSKSDIERYGVAKFNEACRASVLRYVKEWRTVITRLGRWVDFDNDYKTMEAPYMETIWHVLASLWEKDLLYEGHYILPYCPRCATVLSNHELNLGGYKDVHDPAITVRFRITGAVPGSSAARNVEAADLAQGAGGAAYLLAWTTTPWTLPSNLALVLGPDISYVMIQDGADRYILAESRLNGYYNSETGYRIIWHKKGEELLGINYEPLFPYFAYAAENGAFRTYPGDYVTTEDGTGIVHTAPGFGEDDERVLRGTGIPMVCPVDAECRFTGEVADYQGLFVKDADRGIIERLKTEGKLVKRDQILHAYPHCWRCGSPLVYRAVVSWFVSVEKIKAAMLKANSEIHWVPEHIKGGRFGKWLEGARDWAISRNRYWGNPLPIWRCDDCGKTICIGSREELKALSGKTPEDLHKHFVDEITIPCVKSPDNREGVEKAVPCRGIMKRIPEVLDCWFESGAMPYGQNHYPFENKQFFEDHFPADFISEGLDQTRGWFYTLHVLAAALFKRPAFNNCIVSGLVLASDGKKMSKSLKNYTDPMEVVNSFGADALRLFLIHSAVVKAEDLRYSDEGVREVMKSIIIPLWSAYSFLVTYANIDKVEIQGAPDSPSNPLDRWILSEAENLKEKTGEALEAYDLSRAVNPILEFIDKLNNWYIRRSRRRFWKSTAAEDSSSNTGGIVIDNDKADAYGSLFEALKTLITAAAPFMPFTTDAIWQNLRLESDPPSVHLADYPEPRENRRDRNLEFKMAAVLHAVSMGRALRSQYSLKIRQPLKTVELVTRNPEEKKALLEMEDSIREELNVKNVVFRENEEDLVEYEAKANFRVLGKELGKDMKAAAERIAALNQTEIQGLLEGAALSIDLDTGRSVEITSDKLDIRRIEKAKLRVLNEGTLTVALDTEITEELSQEGDVRDLVRGVQNARKEAGLEVTDRIVLCIFGSSRLRQAWEAFADYVADETLASAVEWGETKNMIQFDSGETTWFIKITKA